MSSDERVLLSVADDVLLVRYPDDTFEDVTLPTLGRSPVQVEAVSAVDSADLAADIAPTGVMQSWLQCVRMMPRHLRASLESCPLDQLVMSLNVLPRDLLYCVRFHVMAWCVLSPRQFECLNVFLESFNISCSTQHVSHLLRSSSTIR